MEEKASIVKHEGVKRLNGKLDFVDGSVVLDGNKVPDEVLGASYYNYGTPEKLQAYVNGHIENTKNNKYRNLHGLYPFVDDGTLFVTEKVSHQSIKDALWPNMTSGVQRYILNKFRDKDIQPLVYAVGIFGSEWNPNQQMKMVDEILDGSRGTGSIAKTLLKLEGILEHKDTIIEWFQFDKPNKWTKAIEQDAMWWDHVAVMAKSIVDIHKFSPGYVIPLSYPFGELQSLLNKIIHRLSGETAVFNDYYFRYCFFDSLRIGELTVMVPRDSVDMVDNGAHLSICVGGEGYINKLARNRGMILFFYKDGQPFICAEKYLNKTDADEYAEVEGNQGNKDGFQIMYKNNRTVIGDERKVIKELMNAMYTADKVKLMAFVTPEFLEVRLQWLAEKFGKKMFGELKKTYLPNLPKNADINMLKTLFADDSPALASQ